MELPLASPRVLDLTEGDAQYCGRYLAAAAGQAELLRLAGTADIVLESSSHAQAGLGLDLRCEPGRVAAVIGRARSGHGAAVEVAQADVAVMYLGPVPASLGADGGSPGETARVLPCAGDDEWCVIDVRDDGDRTRSAALVGGTDLARWTSARRPDEVMAAVQAAGVPAGSMRRLPELLTAPVPGEHTRDIGRTLLGLSPADIDRLVHDGVRQEGSAT